jgi:ferric-dicitrate binding protein FerR (iron transport regulator)
MEHQNNIKQIASETEKLFSGAKIEWDKDKDSIFSETFDTLISEPETKVVGLKQNMLRLSIAASFLLLVGVGTFAFLFSKTVYSPAGNHLTAELPDGSTVEMNAQTTLKYYPYRWFFQRNVEFSGEGYFSVEKGKKFTVTSTQGNTTVLGTTFNIFARDDSYRVFCKTGTVKVSNPSGEFVILAPNQKTMISAGVPSEPVFVSESENILSWRNNIFLYNAAPFTEVVREIERQYGISITSENKLSGTISVNFQKSPNVEKVLSMVCKPLGYSYVKKSDKQYEIIKNN